MELEYNRVIALTRNTSTLRRNQLLKRFLDHSKDKVWDHIETGLALVIWVTDFLAHIQLLSLDKQTLIVDSKLGDILYEFGNDLGDCLEDTAVPAGHLCLIDRKYICAINSSWPVNEPRPYLDLNTGDIVDYGKAYSNPPLEVINYNLNTLFMKNLSAYNRLVKQAKEVEHATRTDRDS